jgi:hypothetical protein
MEEIFRNNKGETGRKEEGVGFVLFIDVCLAASEETIT